MRKLFLLIAILWAGNLSAHELKLWYQKPAKVWTDALPIGNGRLGAMIYGIPDSDIIQLNEETIWAGSPYNNVNYSAKDHLGEIRQLLFQDRRKEAYDLCNKYILTTGPYCTPYQTAGFLYLDFNIKEYTDYYRELDIEDAVTTTKFKANGVEYKREALASFKDQVIVLHLTASKKGSVSFKARYSLDGAKASLLKDNLAEMQIGSRTDDVKDVKGQVKFLNKTIIKSDGGNIKVNGNDLEVENANEVTIYISIGTNFINYDDVSGDETIAANKPLSSLRQWEQIKEDNIKYYRKQFSTVSLDLGINDQAKKPTDIRLAEFKSKFDPEFVELYFQFNRYLMISCSQPGGQPANLQGIWNSQRNPMWGSKYTTNINLQMCYWPSYVCGLPENFEPFFHLVKDLSIRGKESGRMYGCRGWTIHHNTDIWRSTGMIDGAYWGMWPTGSAWLSQQIWDAYLFNQNPEFLKEIYPIMKSAAEFYIDFLTEEPVSGHKYLVIAPSVSPENAPSVYQSETNKGISTSFGTAMDNELMAALFENTIEAARLMDEKQPFIDTLQNIKSRLAPIKIGRWGQLQEWFQDWDNPKDQHRHVSHLWGLYPGDLISQEKTPDLFNAARTSLIARGDKATGWSMAWKVCLWARLMDGNHAYKLMSNLLSPFDPKKGDGGTYTNLFDACPPFVIDANFGCLAAIAEMLLQSHNGKIVLLPAIPDIWKNGSVKGLRARGGFIVEELSWKDGKPTHVKIKSTVGGTLSVAYKDKQESVETVKGKTYDIKF